MCCCTAASNTVCQGYGIIELVHAANEPSVELDELAELIGNLT